MATVADNIVSYWDIGAGTNPATKYVQYVDSRGWKRFVDTYLAGEINAGIRRFYLWMPFGHETDPTTIVDPFSTAGDTYDTSIFFDQWLRGSPVFQNWGFESAIRELTSSGIEVIAHMGDLRGHQFPKRWTAEQWIENCLEPFMNAGCNICFNDFGAGGTDFGSGGGVASAQDHSADYRLAQKLSHYGIKVYCGGGPFISESQPDLYKWNRGNVLTQYSDYATVLGLLPATENDPGVIALDEVEGELVLGFGWGELSEEDWVAEYESTIPGILSLGYSACIRVSNYLNDGGILADLIP